MRDDILHSLNLPRLDPPPCPHNIVMGGSEFIKVASCFVTREVQRETARWMSSRKWELGESFESSKVTKLVSKRANATQIESSLNSRNNPLAWWKERVPVFTPSRTRTCADLLASVKSYLSTDLKTSEETQMAFQSIKKLLPESCKCLKSGLLTDLRARLSRPPPTLPAGYLSFAREISSEIFAKGWDRSWLDKVDTFAPSLSSCQGFSRKQGGQLAALAVTGHEHYKERMTGAPFGELEGELLVVDSSGKPRPLTRFGPESAFLRPLHGLMYDTISRKKWLLRGEVTEAALNEAGFDPTKKVE